MVCEVGSDVSCVGITIVTGRITMRRKKVTEGVQLERNVSPIVAAVTVSLEQRKKRVVKYLQPYFKQGNRWFRLKVK